MECEHQKFLHNNFALSSPLAKDYIGDCPWCPPRQKERKLKHIVAEKMISEDCASCGSCVEIANACLDEVQRVIDEAREEIEPGSRFKTFEELKRRLNKLR